MAERRLQVEFLKERTAKRAAARAELIANAEAPDPFIITSTRLAGLPIVYLCPQSPPSSKKGRKKQGKDLEITPTKPQLRQSISIMDRRYPSLPTTGGGPPQYHFPQHLVANQNPSTGSTDSVDSIQTQIPLPYHLPQGYAAPWETPAIPQGPAMDPMLPYQGNAKLNPTSHPYVPGNFPPNLSSNSRLSNPSFDSVSTIPSQAWSSNGSGHYSRDTSFSSDSSYSGPPMDIIPYQHGPQYGAPPGPPYQHSNPHFQHNGGMMGPPPPVAAASAFITGPNMQLHGYSQQAMPPLHHSNSYIGMQGQMGHYPSAPNHGSPALSYTTMGSPTQSYNASVYTDQPGLSQAWNSIYPNGATGMYNDGYGNGVGNNYGGGSYAAHQQSSYGGSSGYFNSQSNYQGDNSQSNYQGDNFGNNYQANYQGNKQNYVQGNYSKGKHVDTSSASHKSNAGGTNGDNNNTKAKGKGGRKQNRNKSAAQSGKKPAEEVPDRSADNQSRASSRPSLGSQDTKVNSIADAATPVPQPRVLDADCKSEPRFTETPVLRSRRGQSITKATATDPGRKSSVDNWLEKQTPTNNQLISEKISEEGAETIKRLQSPPKMPVLFNGSSSFDPTSLKPINENDPFVTRNVGPFGNSGSITTVGPYQGGTLLSKTGMSKELAQLTRGGTSMPTIEEALAPHHFPLIEYCRKAKAEEYGVIKIKNIPYSVNRPEVLAFLGRNAKILAEQDKEPVHIVMERVTSKTLDCYVEFVNFDEAVSAVNRFDTNRTGGRGGRLGQRHVEVELSSQEALMHDLFPKSKNVTWHGSRPIVHPRDPNDKYNSGFQGFVSQEELVMLVKHVEAPQRSPFSKECPQRPFECLISTLIKFPWYMVDYITIQDRARIHKATTELLTLLVDRVKNNIEDVNLTSMLLKRVWKAALRCPGFTPIMKDDIVYIAGIGDDIAREYGVAPFAVEWKNIYTIGPKVDAPHDLVMWYVSLIRNTTEARKPQLSLADQAASEENEQQFSVFGDLKAYINHNMACIHNMTLGQVAKAEWAAIERILRMGLTHTLEG